MSRKTPVCILTLLSLQAKIGFFRGRTFTTKCATSRRRKTSSSALRDCSQNGWEIASASIGQNAGFKVRASHPPICPQMRRIEADIRTILFVMICVICVICGKVCRYLSRIPGTHRERVRERLVGTAFSFARRDRVVAAGVEGVAFEDSFGGQPETQQPVRLNGFRRIHRTGRLKSAGRRHER